MQIPESAGLYSVLAPGKSVITIGFLQEAKDLINQISHLKAVALEKDDSIAQIKEEMKSAKVHLHMQFQAQSARMTNNHENLTKKHSECVEENKGRFGQMEEMILDLNQQVSVLIAESNDLKRLFKKGIDLANNVKRRVALTAASEEVEKILGRKEEEKELWSFSF